MQTNEQVVVHLVVSADGALRNLNKYDTAMEGAGQATTRTGATLDAFNAQLARQRAAMEAGIPVLKARAAVMSIEEKMLTGIYEKVDGVAKARLVAERELSRAAASASNLVVQGKMAEEEAIRQLMAIEAAHAKAIDRAIADAGRFAVANDNVTASYHSRGAAARSAGQFNAGNIGAQLFDVAVTAPFMPAWQVGLQQGTQLSQAFAGQTLKQSIVGVGAALASLANPLSILTIGLAGLTAGGIQWAMSIMEGAEDANTALESHLAWLDEMLTGYERAETAAVDFVQAASTRPTGAVQSDLETQRVTLLRQVDDLLAEIGRKEIEINTDMRQMALNPMIHRDTLEAAAGLDALGLSAQSTDSDIDALQERLTRLANDSGASDQARQYARDLLGMIDRLDQTRGNVNSLGVAINNLPNNVDINIRLNGLTGVFDAVEQLRRMTPDLRTVQQQADDLFSQNVQMARTTSEIDGLVNAHNELTLALIREDMARRELSLSQKAHAYDDQATDVASFPTQWSEAA